MEIREDLSKTEKLDRVGGVKVAALSPSQFLNLLFLNWDRKCLQSPKETRKGLSLVRLPNYALRRSCAPHHYRPKPRSTLSPFPLPSSALKL